MGWEGRVCTHCLRDRLVAAVVENPEQEARAGMWLVVLQRGGEERGARPVRADTPVLLVAGLGDRSWVEAARRRG